MSRRLPTLNSKDKRKACFYETFFKIYNLLIGDNISNYYCCRELYTRSLSIEVHLSSISIVMGISKASK